MLLSLLEFSELPDSFKMGSMIIDEAVDNIGCRGGTMAAAAWSLMPKAALIP